MSHQALIPIVATNQEEEMISNHLFGFLMKLLVMIWCERRHKEAAWCIFGFEVICSSTANGVEDIRSKQSEFQRSSTPGVPDVPTYGSDDEQISWKSSDGEDDDEVALNDDDDDNNDDDGNDDDNDDADNQDDDGQEYDEHDDEEQGDDDEQTDSDNDGDDFVHLKFSTHDEEDKKEDSFDPRIRNDALYRDVNVNLEGRDTDMTDAPCTIIQTTQVIEDTHVIITLVNPEGQQQSSLCHLALFQTCSTPVQTQVLPTIGAADSRRLKNFKKDATLKLFKSTNQERYEHVGPEVTSSQGGKVNKMAKRDYAWLMISRCSRSHSRQAKEQAQDLKSMITTSNHKNTHSNMATTRKTRDPTGIWKPMIVLCMVSGCKTDTKSISKCWRWWALRCDTVVQSPVVMVVMGKGCFSVWEENVWEEKSTSHGKMLGSIFDATGASMFNKFIFTSGLCDLPMGDLWPYSYVTALTREFSDHTPLLLSNSITDYGPTPFKFFKSKLQHLKSSINKWRSDIQGVESAATAKVMDLRQKAKVRWALDGDENSHFFYGMLNSKLNHSRINGLNILWSWIINPVLIKNHIYQFYESKFKETSNRRPSFTSNLFKHISVEDSNILDCTITPQEIKDAIWDCGGDKAPSPDVFPNFLKSIGSFIKDDINA
ncbi:hypothetical protein Tco_0860243 [Tanacetum coccineum]|uniref:RNA-directed DNA polymerase, eukaryota, reverse transcriptase zinc-binding domain protein n=1 Tax=Tanacetum coccineum TaxID=301880 RepID=A0ABQ5BHU0_9ASTR